MANSIEPWMLQQDTNVPIQSLAQAIYTLACRKDFAQPGFALVRQCGIKSSIEQRQSICSLKEALSELYLEDPTTASASKLDWFNLNRFDQQNSTKPHRDGAPEESLLILGYEPSLVKSELTMSDYCQLSQNMGISPDKFLEDHNPMYDEGTALLAQVTTVLHPFNPDYFQLLVVNNSSAPSDASNPRWQGVLHCAKVNRLEGATRVINSTVVCPANYLNAEERADQDRERWFLTSVDLQESSYL